MVVNSGMVSLGEVWVCTCGSLLGLQQYESDAHHMDDLGCRHEIAHL